MHRLLECRERRVAQRRAVLLLAATRGLVRHPLKQSDAREGVRIGGGLGEREEARLDVEQVDDEAEARGLSA